MTTKPKTHGTRRPVAVRVAIFVATFALLCTLAFTTRSHSETSEATPATESTAAASQLIINTSDLERRIIGYAGKVPVEIFVTDGRIDSVRSLPNNETPSFFDRVVASGLPDAWRGHTLREAATMHVDAVSGATFSSEAYIENVREGAARELGLQAERESAHRADLIKYLAAFIVIVMGAVLPLFVRSKRYRIVQQVLNAAVLGFWAGTFLDYALMLRVFSLTGEFTLATTATVALLVVGLVYPLFGREAHYCTWVCPLGSMQDLAGRLSRRKVHMSAAAVKRLRIFRRTLWGVLMVYLLTGWWVAWLDYELFSAFVVRSAAWGVLVAAGVFIVLAVVIPRPYCRFVCPTGTLLQAR